MPFFSVISHFSVRNQEVYDLLFDINTVRTDWCSKQTTVNAHQCMFSLQNLYLMSAVRMYAAVVKKASRNQ